jgi:hypothetical protein
MKTKAKPATLTEFAQGWTPVRRGHIYCSPRCGGDCTYAKFQLATNEANRIANLMGKGWTPDVHENLGWHYDVISPCRRIRVHGPYAMIHMGEPFMVTIGEKDEVGFQWSASSKNPKTAMKKVIALAKADLAKLGAKLKGL